MSQSIVRRMDKLMDRAAIDRFLERDFRAFRYRDSPTTVLNGEFECNSFVSYASVIGFGSIVANDAA